MGPMSGREACVAAGRRVGVHTAHTTEPKTDRQSRIATRCPRTQQKLRRAPMVQSARGCSVSSPLRSQVHRSEIPTAMDARFAAAELPGGVGRPVAIGGSRRSPDYLSRKTQGNLDSLVCPWAYRELARADSNPGRA